MDVNTFFFGTPNNLELPSYVQEGSSSAFPVLLFMPMLSKVKLIVSNFYNYKFLIQLYSWCIGIGINCCRKGNTQHIVEYTVVFLNTLIASRSRDLMLPLQLNLCIIRIYFVGDENVLRSCVYAIDKMLANKRVMVLFNHFEYEV